MKCKHVLNTYEAELIHCKLNVLNLLNLISGGGVSLCGPYESLEEYGWKPYSQQVCHGPQATGTCVKHRGVSVSLNSRFQTVRFQQYAANLLTT